MDNKVKSRILERLEALGKSRRGASKEAGLGETAIRDLLNNDTQSPRLDTLRKLAPVLEVTVEWLTTGKGDKTDDPLLSEVIGFWKHKLGSADRQEIADYVRFKSRSSNDGK